MSTPTCACRSAYDVGHPLELLVDWPPSRRGEWSPGVVAYRAPGCNQFAVRMSPFNMLYQPLLPWNHRPIASATVPLTALRVHDESSWGGTDAVDAVGIGEDFGEPDGADEDEGDGKQGTMIEIEVAKRMG